MTVNRKTFLLSGDASLIRRVEAYLETIARVEVSDSDKPLLAALRRASSPVVVLDSRHPEAFAVLDQLASPDAQNVPVVAFAESKSDPERELANHKLFAVFPLQFERTAFQRIMLSACEVARLKAEAKDITKATDDSAHASGAITPDLGAVTQLLKGLAPSQDVFLKLVEVVGGLLGTSRTGLIIGDGKDYRFVAGTKLDESVRDAVWTRNDELVQVLLHEAKPLRRGQLRDWLPGDEAEMIEDHLEQCRVETIVPVFIHDRLLGWYLLGKPMDEASPLSQVMAVCEATAGLIDHALEHDRLQIKHDLLDSVVSSLPIGLLAFDVNCKLLWLNQRASEIMGETFESVLAQKTAVLPVAFTSAFMQLMKSPSEVYVDCELDDRTFRVSLLKRDQVEDASAASLLFSVIDRTDAERLEAERLQRGRAELLCEMNDKLAFMLRSPLTAIRSFAQLLPENQSKPDFAQRFNEIVCSEVDRLVEISDNLGTVSRIAGKHQESDEPFTIEETVGVVRGLVGERWERCRVKGLQPHFSLVGDGDRLAEALCYLIDNALDASEEEVDLAFMPAESLIGLSLEIAVRDRRATRSTGAFVDNSILIAAEAREKADTRIRLAARIVGEFGATLKSETTASGVCVYTQLALAESV